MSVLTYRLSTLNTFAPTEIFISPIKSSHSIGIPLCGSVTYATREQMPKGHQNDKGYYNPNTGEIVICTENASSIADAIQTILHETVAHKGQRELMGDKFNEFINRVYESLDAEASPYVLNNQRRQVQQTISRILKPRLTFLIP